MSNSHEIPADVCEAIGNLFPDEGLEFFSWDRTVRLYIKSCHSEIKLSQLQELASLIGADDIAVKVDGDISGFGDYAVPTVEVEINCTGVDIPGLGRACNG